MNPFVLQVPIDQITIEFDSESLWLLNIALAFVMFGIALDIKTSDFGIVFRSPVSVLAGMCSQFLILPALTFLLVWTIDPLPSFALGMILVASCPGGNVSNFMSHLAGGNTALSVSLTAIATILAIGLTPLNFQFWGSMYPPAADILQTVHIEWSQMVWLVAMLLGFPLVLGMGLRRLRPIWANRLSGYFRKASLLFFVLLVVLAVWKDRAVFMEYIGWVFSIVLLHNLLALATGYTIGRGIKLPIPDVKTLTLETGIQNSGLGLLLIFTFFDGLGGMALVAACWGIWHLISGLLIAGLWSTGALQNKQTI